MKKIIIADDEPLIRLTLSIQLKARGYNIVAETKNGRDTIKNVAIHKPDIIFMDIDMETHTDGIDTCKIIKQENPGIKIILVSAYPVSEFAEYLKKSLHDGYIEKPPLLENLVSFIND